MGDDIKPRERSFGLGFGGTGDTVSVYLNEGPTTGALLEEQQRKAVEQWAGSDDSRTISEVVNDPEKVAAALYNRLLHLDTLERIDVLPDLLDALPIETRQILFGEENCARISAKIWNKIADGRKSLRLDTKHPHAHYSTLCESGIGQGIRTHDKEGIYFNQVNLETVAILLPMLIGVLAQENRSQVTEAIVQALHNTGWDKEIFTPLSNPNLNRVVINSPAHTPSCKAIINNGRTIKVMSAGGSSVDFQGETYHITDFHFHRLKNTDNSAVDAAPEYHRYEDASHEAQQMKKRGDNLDKEVVGELHTICVAGGKHALALSAQVKLGPHNEGLEPYIHFLKDHHGEKPLAVNQALDASGLEFNPFACYKQQPFTTDGLPLAPFVSLNLGGTTTDEAGKIQLKEKAVPVFANGVRVVHLREPISISKEQLQTLQSLQPTLMELDDEEFVKPLQCHQPPPPQRLRQVDATDPVAQSR